MEKLSAVLITGALATYCLYTHWQRTKESEPKNHDRYYESRYSTQDTLTCHHGSCHCGRVKFKLFAPKVLRCVDVSNTKIRFIRFSTKHEFFETICGEEFVSHYAVHNENSSSVGIYIFCSFCSVQLLYAPTINPVEVQVNAECLDRATVLDIEVAYLASLESITATDLEHQFGRRGFGSLATDNSSRLIWNLLHSYYHEYSGGGQQGGDSPSKRRSEGKGGSPRESNLSEESVFSIWAKTFTTPGSAREEAADVVGETLPMEESPAAEVILVTPPRQASTPVNGAAGVASAERPRNMSFSS